MPDTKGMTLEFLPWWQLHPLVTPGFKVLPLVSFSSTDGRDREEGEAPALPLGKEGGGPKVRPPWGWKSGLPRPWLLGSLPGLPWGTSRQGLLRTSGESA